MAGKKGKAERALQAAPAGGSPFQVAVVEAGLTPHGGKEAIEGSYRANIIAAKGCSFTGSVDVDAHFSASEGRSPRWDYGLGLQNAAGEAVACWVEPHPASSTGEVAKMLAKLEWLKAKLNEPEFKALRRMTYASTSSPFHWLLTETGGCRISAGSADAKRLAKQGLRMPTRQVVLP